MSKTIRKDEGFTLVELMVVVLIIGILVSIAIPIFNNATTKAKLNTCKANIRTINGAISQYATGADAPVLITTTEPLVTGAYLKTAPECPYDIPYDIIPGTGDFAADVSAQGVNEVPHIVPAVAATTGTTPTAAVAEKHKPAN